MIGRVRRALRPVRRSSARVDQLTTWIETVRLLQAERPVLIFSMGKTGTTTIEASIEAGTSRSTLKAHALTRAGIRRRIEQEKLENPAVRPRFWWRSQALRWDLLLQRGQSWDVITCVRDPIARAVSAYFYRVALGVAPAGPARDRNNPEFHASGVHEMIRHTALEQDWFSDEFEPVTGIDVYAQMRGELLCDEHVNGRFRVLFVRAEDLPTTAPERLGRFLGQSGPLPLVTANVGDNEHSDSAYGRFLDEWRFEPELVEHVYATRLARQFYDQDEREALADRWSR